MKRFGFGLLALAIAFGFGVQTASAAAADEVADQSTMLQKARQNVHRARVLGRPDLAGAFAGVGAYLDKQYDEALKSFKHGARYGDKLSQLSIGLMYLNGEGVQSNAATAWAWMDLASEDANPNYIATRDDVWSQLDASQRDEARSMRDSLAKTYADEVTEPRLHRALRHVRIERNTMLPPEKASVAVNLTPVHMR